MVTSPVTRLPRCDVTSDALGCRSVTVIVISERSPGGEFHVRRLMETVWDAMVLCVGWDDLANIANVERVKRQLKVRATLGAAPRMCGFVARSGLAKYIETEHAVLTPFRYFEELHCSAMSPLLFGVGAASTYHGIIPIFC